MQCRISSVWCTGTLLMYDTVSLKEYLPELYFTVMPSDLNLWSVMMDRSEQSWTRGEWMLRWPSWRWTASKTLECSSAQQPGLIMRSYTAESDHERPMVTVS